jgi:hypothetical protein
MKPSNLFLKITVLSFFILFLIGFVAYRSGALNKWFSSDSSPVQQTEMNSPVAAQNRTDSPRVFKLDTSGFYFDVMSSSKSGYLIYPDTPKKKTKKLSVASKDTPVIKADTPKIKRVLPSSKSGRLIHSK